MLAPMRPGLMGQSTESVPLTVMGLMSTNDHKKVDVDKDSSGECALASKIVDEMFSQSNIAIDHLRKN